MQPLRGYLCSSLCVAAAECIHKYTINEPLFSKRPLLCCKRMDAEGKSNFFTSLFVTFKHLTPNQVTFFFPADLCM